MGFKLENVAGTAAARSPGPNSTGSGAGHSVTAGNVIWATGNLLVKVESQGAHVADGSVTFAGGTLNLGELSVGTAFTALVAAC